MEKSERDIFEEALTSLLANPALGEFHEQLRELQAELNADPSPIRTIAQRGRAADLLLQLQLGGYLDEEPPLQQPPPVIVEDYGLYPPSPEKEVELSRLPSLEERLDLIRKIMQEETSAGRAAQSDQNVTTFLFLHDPQPSRVQGRDDDNPRVQSLSQLNTCLNQIDQWTWPRGFHLRCEGQPIGPIAGIFFAGDLCQAGGDYDFFDQLVHLPWSFRGGWELAIMRHLFQKSFVYPSKATKTKYDKVYFGLGNHDVQTEYHPAVGWRWGWAGCNSFLPFSSADDYNRYQMWNFVCQMHTGVWGQTKPVIPVTTIDGTGDAGSYCWKEHSLNYCVNLGPVDLFQMHVYGGDRENGRADGLSWLKDQLALRDISRPIIIVQHYSFDITSDEQPNWTKAQRDAFLAVLEPYNVIALLTGHAHAAGAFPDIIPIPHSTKTFDQFRPGMCSDYGGFALMRVSDISFDTIQGSTVKGKIEWIKGYSKSISNTTNTTTQVLEGKIMPVTFITWDGGAVFPSGTGPYVGYTLGAAFPVEGGRTYRISAVFDYLAQGPDPLPSQFPGIDYRLSTTINETPGPQIPGGTLSGGTRYAWVKGAIMGLFAPGSSGDCQLRLVIAGPPYISGTGTIANLKLTVEEFQPTLSANQGAS